MRISATCLGLMLAAAVALAQNPATPSPQAPDSASHSPSSEAASPLKIQKYRGTLVDAACAGSSANATPTSSAGQSSEERQSSSSAATAGTANEKTGNGKGEASRSTDAGSNCGVTSNSTEFALQTRQGRTLRFDAVGNERAKENIAGRKGWKNASAAGKPIQATIRGSESGDDVIVYSIR